MSVIAVGKLADNPDARGYTSCGHQLIASRTAVYLSDATAR
jgi:hypothetical protein